MGVSFLVQIDPMNNKRDMAASSFSTFMGRNCGAAFLSRDKDKDG